MTKNFLFLGIMAALVAVGLAGYGDFGDTWEEIGRLPLLYLAAALALAFANYLLRLVRWALYLNVLGIRIPAFTSCLVFFSGLAMSITPGKAGELVKCYLLRSRSGVPISQTAPVVLMERLTDVISVVLLSLIGFAVLPIEVVAVVSAVLVLTVGAVGFIVYRGPSRLAGLPVFRRWRQVFEESHDALRTLAAPRVMAGAVLLAAAAWMMEGLALWVILRGLDTDLSLTRALPIYTAATLVGAVTALPGGLIGTEGSMLALLQQSGIARAGASASTLLVRLVTLWFAVVLGLVAFALLRWVGTGTVADIAEETPGTPADVVQWQSTQQSNQAGG